MKKYLFSALALGMMLTSCQSDEPFAPGEGGEKQVTFTLNVPGNIGTRAASGESGAQNNQNANIYYTLVLDANGDKRVLQETTTEKTVTFTTPVVLGRKYDITAYASYTNNIDANASNIKAIPVEKSFNDETKDAYTAHVEDHDFALNALPAMQLKRPFGKLRLIATDYVDEGTAKNTKIDQVTVTYNNTTVTTYDATTAFFNNVGTGITATKDFVKYYDAESEGMPIFADYLPANGEGQDNPITFTVTVRYAESTETYSRTFNDIPVRRNALTTLKGNFFTAGAEIKVEIKDNFEGGEFVSVATASQLQDAINKGGNGETIILTDDIVLTEPLVFSVNSSSSAPTRSGATNSFVLNLNGKNITGTDSGTASYGLITINKGADLTIEGNGTISLTATQDRDWKAYSSVISNQQGKLTVNGGTIEHNGGTDMAYAIDNLTNGKGTYAETIINGGTIKSTYRAIRQFLNGVEAQNILTVNGGKIEGDNKSIWMQDPSKNANTGELFVAADAELYGDVYLFVTEGSTEWPVEVQIANAALQGESTVTSGNVPAGYSVIEENGVWKVVSISDILEANFADNSWENIILACQSNCVPETWNVGDKKDMTIGGKEYKIAIIGKNHDTYTDGGTAPLTFQLAEVYGTTAAMNETQTNTTGWSGSKMRTTTMAGILNAMPSEAQNAIKAVNKETLNGTRDGLETTSDKLFLLSEIEVNGSVYFSNNFAEGSRYPYYTDVNSQIMNSGNKPATWWLRGPGKSNAIGFTQINMSGYMANGSAEYACGVVFGFCF